MIFDDRYVDEIEDDEFDALVKEHISERQHLEYKGTYKIKDDDDRLEVLRDIASLANGGGGYLIIGVQDDGTGAAAGYVPQTKEDLERMKKSIQHLCLDHIAERIPRLEFRIRNPDNHPILIIHVPDSIQAPHMIKFNRRTDFYTRYDEGKREMSVTEIRRAFQEDRVQLSLNSMSYKMDDLIRVLLSKEPSEPGTIPFFPSSFSDGSALVHATYNRLMVEIGDKPYFWIAATPKSLDRDSLNVDSPKIREIVNVAPGSRKSGWNMELSATIRNIPDGIERGPKEFEYLALYRNAHMEFWTPLDRHFCWAQQPGEFAKRPELYPYPVVEYPVTFLRLYQAILDSSGLKGEFAVNLRYLNLKGYRLRPYSPKQAGYMFADEMTPFPYDHLPLPPLFIDHSFDPDRTAYQLLVQVYSAFGLSSETIPFFHQGSFSFPS